VTSTCQSEKRSEGNCLLTISMPMVDFLFVANQPMRLVVPDMPSCKGFVDNGEHLATVTDFILVGHDPVSRRLATTRLAPPT